MGTYQAPSALTRWTVDVSHGELYELTMLTGDRVCMVSGHFAHNSASTSYRGVVTRAP